tara:strand:- start:207 stop:509 length:303 start_codon:yes stop_codon:yes gene_type:complete
MIELKYYYKNGNGLEYQCKRKLSFKEAVKKAKTYNTNINSDVYIKFVTDLKSSPRQTQCLTYSIKPLTKIRVKSTNGGLLKGSVWDNVYMIPYGDDELAF